MERTFGTIGTNEEREISMEKKDGLTVVDIGNFYLLSEKYKTCIEETGIDIDSSNNRYFIKKCSESLSDQLRIMDDCQKMLYGHGYQKENIEHMRKVRDMFKEGVETMQEVLKTFSIVLDE